MAARDAITDVPGLQVGHDQRLDDERATGASVLLAPDGAAAAVDVRGGGPGTRETDVLAPDHLVQRVHAVLLAGGSAFGLAAADGVMRWLAERGRGVPVGPDPAHVVPVVPAAVLFDLPLNEYRHHPDAEFGHRACAAAADEEPAQGNVGAGTGAVAGDLKGGLGTAATTVGGDTAAAGTTVGALWAVNSAGPVVDATTGLPWHRPPELRAPDPAEVAAARGRAGARPGRHGPAGRPLNTTIGAVATDAALDKAQARRLAVAAHDGIARAVRPAHGLTDGDTAFALATGRSSGWPEVGSAGWAAALDALCAAAAEVTARAIVRGVLAADPVGEVSCYTARYPSTRE
ncbi:P1 family peptidase [Salinifilum ghardaiensis]